MSKSFLLQRKPSGYLGNAPVFWKKGGDYTSYIQNAELFSAEQAHKKVASDPEKWEAWPIHEVVQRCHLVVDHQEFPIKEPYQQHVPSGLALEVIYRHKNCATMLKDALEACWEAAASDGNQEAVFDSVLAGCVWAIKSQDKEVAE